jgi:hypothetical protein
MSYTLKRHDDKDSVVPAPTLPPGYYAGESASQNVPLAKRLNTKTTQARKHK